MSSVRDRIRDFQHSEHKPDASAPPQPSSVSKIAKSLEAPPASVPSSNPTAAPDQGIGARVRRFNATSTSSPSSPTPTRSIPASKSLQPGLASTTFASHTSTLLVQSSGSQPARRTASDNEDGRVNRGRTGETSEKQSAETHVGNARRKFESQQDDRDNGNSGANPKIHVTTTKKTTEVVTTVYSRPSALETAGTYGVPTGGSAVHHNDSTKDGKDVVSARAAKFEKTGGPKREIAENAENPDQSAHKNVTSNGASARLQENSGPKEKNQMMEELAEVRSLNEKLVKSLLNLNEQYCHLEKSRDNLQKRVAELEANAK